MAYKNYTNTFYSERGNRWDIEIWSQSDTSTGHLFDTGSGGFKLSYKGSDDRNQITKSSEVTIPFIVTNTAQESYLSTLLSADDQEYFVLIRRNFVVFWWGGLRAGFDSFANEYYPYTITLKANDFIGDMVNLKTAVPVPSDPLLNIGSLLGDAFYNNAKISENGFLSAAFPFGSDELISRLNNRWVGQGQQNLSTINPFAQQYVDTNNFIDSNYIDKYSKSSAYKGILKSLGMQVFQSDGIYNIIQPFSLENDTITSRRKTHTEAGEWFSFGNEYETIDVRQNASNDITDTLTIDSGFKGGEWLEEPADFTTWSAQGSVTSITNNSFNITLTTSYLYISLTEGYYYVSFSQNMINTQVVYADTSGADNVLLTESGGVNFQVGATGGRLKIMSTTTGTKSVEFIGLQKGTLANRTFLAGQQWRYERPLSKVLASFDYGTDVALLESNAASTTNTIYTNLTTIGAISSANLEGASFNFDFQYFERFDSVGTTVGDIGGSVEVKIRIGSWYLAGSIFSNYWTTTISTLTIDIPTDTGSASPLNASYEEGPTLMLPSWMASAGALPQLNVNLDINLPPIPVSGSIEFQFVTSTIDFYSTIVDPTDLPTPITLVKDNLETRYSVHNMGLVVAATEGETQTGIQFSASTSNLDNFEQYDLGSIPIGLTGDEGSYTKCLRVVNSSFEKIVPNYIQVNGAGTSYNITSLLCEEYMSPQLVPLKIIEGEYYVNDFSALKCIVLDGEKYVFSEGTLNASSDTVSGSWYKIEATSEVITTVEEETFEPDIDPPNPPNPHDPTGAELGAKISNVNTQHSYNLNNIVKFNSVGIVGSEISGTGVTSVTIIKDARGKLYDNQKLLLTLSDGSEPVILVKDGISTISDKILDINSFNPSVIYPAGSILSILDYDLTNVITGGGGGTPGGTTRQVQFNDGGSFGAESGFEYDKTTDILTSRYVDGQYLGDNIGTIYDLYIYLTPLDFNISSGYRNPPYTDDDGATLRPSSSGVNYYVSLQIPLGYKAVKVDLRSSSNDSFWVGSSAWNSSSISTLDSGTTNTELTLATSFTGLAGKYMVIKFDPNSTTDEIFGCKITLERV